MNLLDVRDVYRTYRQGGFFGNRARHPVLTGASLHVGSGECVALLGPTGSGKSTLGRLVLGLETPDAGTVCFDGLPLHDRRGRIDRATRRAIQAVFQDPQGATSPRFSAFEVVAEPLLTDRMPTGALRDRVVALLEQVGLPAGIMDRPAHSLSGGQLQRLCIARALAPSPRLIVLDEAVNSLDVETQAQVMALLRRLQEHGVAYLFITHDLRLLKGFADRCYVMQGGRSEEVTDPFGDGYLPSALIHLRQAILPARPVERAKAIREVEEEQSG
ncbi:ATP-binding cassette domain-containing protein [Roseomonas gilardii subsp. gilardii]|uniref:ATP-binding cassette domain-containing protein n=1 Tax=Roseomonas gilardii TaxID=257708 RepID=UPI001FFB6CDF|nr:ATP-binding cassette domain-containing protein [Roseomonas gilardii]UPG73863.1 ATP-binding cassette domain-containing protein [Roseomonas gilardii subsp. gilardii]